MGQEDTGRVRRQLGWNLRIGESVAKGGEPFKQKGWVSRGMEAGMCKTYAQKEQARVCLNYLPGKHSQKGRKGKGLEAKEAVIGKGRALAAG